MYTSAQQRTAEHDDRSHARERALVEAYTVNTHRYTVPSAIAQWWMQGCTGGPFASVSSSPPVLSVRLGAVVSDVSRVGRAGKGGEVMDEDELIPYCKQGKGEGGLLDGQR